MDEQHDKLENIIFTYKDEQAVSDGVLVPFLVGERDTGHRMTRSAYEELADYHRKRGCADYDEAQFLGFFFNELLPLVPAVHETYRHAGILMTNYRFRVISKQTDQTLWYLPNEQSGVTMMLPSDY